MRGILWIQQAPARRRRKTLRLLIFLSAAAICGGLAWVNRSELAAHLQWVRGAADSWLVRHRNALGLSESASPAKGIAANNQIAVVPAAAPAVAAPATAPAISVAAATATIPAAPHAQSAWFLVRGRVYDLISLKPVIGAQVNFISHSSGETIKSHTDAAGRYSLRLPRNIAGGYDVEIRHKDYRHDYLEENEPPYRVQSLGRRQEAASLLLESAVLHVPFLPSESEDEAQYDLILLPRGQRP
jgi:hypothetical protein